MNKNKSLIILVLMLIIVGCSLEKKRVLNYNSHHGGNLYLLENMAKDELETNETAWAFFREKDVLMVNEDVYGSLVFEYELSEDVLKFTYIGNEESMKVEYDEHGDILVTDSLEDGPLFKMIDFNDFCKPKQTDFETLIKNNAFHGGRLLTPDSGILVINIKYTNDEFIMNLGLQWSSATHQQPIEIDDNRVTITDFETRVYEMTPIHANDWIMTNVNNPDEFLFLLSDWVERPQCKK